MNFIDWISGTCLCILTACILFFMRFFRIWIRDIRDVASRLDGIEKELQNRDRLEYVMDKPVEENEVFTISPSPPPVMDGKPTNIDLIRYHIKLYYPTLIEEITNFSSEKLTQTDELLCMMIKLGYNNKEVASVLSITTSSVLTARYRLKRKLQLPEGRQLDSWIAQIGTMLIKP